MQPCWPVPTSDKLVLELAGCLPRNRRSYPLRALIQLLQNLVSGNAKFAYEGEDEKALVLKIPQNSTEVAQTWKLHLIKRMVKYSRTPTQTYLQVQASALSWVKRLMNTMFPMGSIIQTEKYKTSRVHPATEDVWHLHSPWADKNPTAMEKSDAEQRAPRDRKVATSVWGKGKFWNVKPYWHYILFLFVCIFFNWCWTVPNFPRFKMYHKRAIDWKKHMLGLQSGSWHILLVQLFIRHLTSALQFFFIIKSPPYLKGLHWYDFATRSSPGYLDSLTAGSRDIKSMFKQEEPLRRLRTESPHCRQRMTSRDGKGKATQQRQWPIFPTVSVSARMTLMGFRWNLSSSAHSRAKSSPTIKPCLFSLKSMHLETS